MTYHLDKRFTRKKASPLRWILLGVVIFAGMVYIGWPLIQKLDSTISGIAVPIYRIMQPMEEERQVAKQLTKTKLELAREVVALSERIQAQQGQAQQLAALEREHAALTEIVSVASSEVRATDLVLAEILARPNQSVYGTLIISGGSEQGITEDMPVIAHGTSLIGHIQEVHKSSAVVRLLSSANLTTDALVTTEASEEGVLPITIRGEGGSTVSFVVPRDVSLTEGASVFIPGQSTFPVGEVEEILFSEQDPSKQVLVRLGSNIQGLRWVEVVRGKE